MVRRGVKNLGSIETLAQLSRSQLLLVTVALDGCLLPFCTSRATRFRKASRNRPDTWFFSCEVSCVHVFVCMFHWKCAHNLVQPSDRPAKGLLSIQARMFSRGQATARSPMR